MLANTTVKPWANIFWALITAVRSRKPLSLICTARKSQLRAAKRIPSTRIPGGLNAIWKCCGKAQPAPSARCFAKSGVKPEEIAGIGNTGHGNGVYLLDKQGRPLRNGIQSMDSRAADVVTGGTSAISMRRYSRSRSSLSGPRSRTRCSSGSRSMNRRITNASAPS